MTIGDSVKSIKRVHNVYTVQCTYSNTLPYIVRLHVYFILLVPPETFHQLIDLSGDDVDMLANKLIN